MFISFILELLLILINSKTAGGQASNGEKQTIKHYDDQYKNLRSEVGLESYLLRFLRDDNSSAADKTNG